MTKAEMASYLVSLHTLLDAQTKGQRSIPTTILVAEYEKHWELLKDTIQEENEDEARKTERERSTGQKDGTGFKGSEPGRSEPDRHKTRLSHSAV